VHTHKCPRGNSTSADGIESRNGIALAEGAVHLLFEDSAQGRDLPSAGRRRGRALTLSASEGGVVTRFVPDAVRCQSRPLATGR
jgi:hypothetical protein